MNPTNISDDITDIPRLQIRQVTLFRDNGENFGVKVADASKVKGDGILVDLQVRTLKALLRKPITVRLPNDVTGVIGSKNNDRMTGSNVGAVLVGKAGKDVLKGLGASDYLIGNSQGDALFGGSGGDFLFGDGLSDYLNNGLQLELRFNPGLFAFTKGGRDLLVGGAGGDLMSGGGLGDTLKGGGGRDRLIGESGNDSLNGGKNPDILVGGQGRDTLTGGADRDSFVYVTPKEGGDRITDFDPEEDRIVVFGQNFKGGLPGVEAPSFTLNTGLTAIEDDQFRVGARARTRDERFLYNKRNGVLSYDSDGSGRKEATVIATFVNQPELTSVDIFSV